MIKFLCKKDCKEFPDTKNLNIYYGIYDKDGDIWILDDWWVKRGINKENFDKYFHGTYVRKENKKYFEVIE